jgi:fused signal recognition particle receptor
VWYVIVFALLAVLLVVSGTMVVVRRGRIGRRAGSAPLATRSRPPGRPAPQRPQPQIREPGPSGGVFRKDGLGAKVRELFRSTADDAAWKGLEELLLRADVGPKGSADLVGRVRADYAHGADPVALLRGEVVAVLGPDEPLRLAPGRLSVVVVVGVNGTGKTTTIGKLAKRLAGEGHQVTIAAADTFRAAAGEQLEVWARRAGAHLVGQDRGADPGTVAFDAVKSATARGSDVLIVDTAGRLHTKTPLMDELGKIRRVIEKAGGEVEETLLVLDAQTGQNGIAQARAFTDAADVTGVVLTKTDGSAKGGVVLAVREELGVPVRFVGVGEGADDLRPFEAAAFADRLLL